MGQFDCFSNSTDGMMSSQLLPVSTIALGDLSSVVIFILSKTTFEL